MQPEHFSGTGQEAIKASYWLKAMGMGITGISVGCAIGITQKFEPLDDMDVYAADDEDAGKLILTTLLPALVVFCLVIGISGPLSARFGGDMLQEMSKNMDPKDAAKGCLTNAGLVLALFLTMILAAWQQDVGFGTRIAIWYRLFNLFAAEAALRGLVMCILVTLYMEPLDSEAAMSFACDNMQYLGEPITCMVNCIVYFVNVLVLYEFGEDGLWTGILVSLCLAFSLTRMFVVFHYLSAWKNPQISEQERHERRERANNLVKAGLSTKSR